MSYVNHSYVKHSCVNEERSLQSLSTTLHIPLCIASFLWKQAEGKHIYNKISLWIY